MNAGNDMTLATVPPCLYRYMFQFMDPDDVIALGRTNQAIHVRIEAAIGVNRNAFARWYVEHHYENIPARYFRINDWTYAAQSLLVLGQRQRLYERSVAACDESSFFLKLSAMVTFAAVSIIGGAAIARYSSSSNTAGYEFNTDSGTWVPSVPNATPSIGQTQWISSLELGGW